MYFMSGKCISLVLDPAHSISVLSVST